jgi:hypothetical protein
MEIPIENTAAPSVDVPRLVRLGVWLRNLRHWKTARAYRDLTRAMKRDPDFAHSWQCNIACPLMDEGMNHADANQAADRLMRHLFGVKTNAKEHPTADAAGGSHTQNLVTKMKLKQHTDSGSDGSSCWAWTTPDVDMPETYEPVIVAGSLEDEDGYMATHEAFWCGRNWWSVRQRETDPDAKKLIHDVSHWTRMPSLPNEKSPDAGATE